MLIADHEFDVTLSDNDEELARAISRILRKYYRGCLHFTGRKLDEDVTNGRRSVERGAVAMPFYLYPCTSGEASSRDWSGSPLLAVTRDISTRGIGMQCDQPLLRQHYIAEFDCAGQSICMLLELRWQLRKCPHYFVAGFRVLHLIDPPEPLQMPA